MKDELTAAEQIAAERMHLRMQGNPEYWKLDGHFPVPAKDVFEWGQTFERADRRVRHDKVGEVAVSTVFLGMDHGWGDGPLPLLFETMILGGTHDQYQERYSTWTEALLGHERALRLVETTHDE